MSKFCPNCGFEQKDMNNKFCNNCGATLDLKDIVTDKQESRKKNYQTFLSLDEKLDALIVNIVPLIGLIAILTKEKNYSDFSKFHYKQTATLFIVETALGAFAGMMTFIPFTTMVLSIIEIVLVIFQIGACIRAYNGEKFEIPVIKDITNNLWK